VDYNTVFGNGSIFTWDCLTRAGDTGCIVGKTHPAVGSNVKFAVIIIEKAKLEPNWKRAGNLIVLMCH